MDEKLFKELVIASKSLVTVTNLAAETLSEQFKSMVTGPLENAKEVLSRCPDPDSGYTGSFRLQDCVEESYAADVPDHPTGVKLTHIPTGLNVISYTATSREENRERATRALKKRVEARTGSVL